MKRSEKINAFLLKHFSLLQTALLLNLLNLLDVISTYMGIEYLDATEMNPVVAPIIELGWGYFIAFKIIVMGIASFFLFRKKAMLAMLFVCMLYTFVVLSNLFQPFFVIKELI